MLAYTINELIEKPTSGEYVSINCYAYMSPGQESASGELKVKRGILLCDSQVAGNVFENGLVAAPFFEGLAVIDKKDKPLALPLIADSNLVEKILTKHHINIGRVRIIAQMAPQRRLYIQKVIKAELLDDSGKVQDTITASISSTPKELRDII